MNPNYGYGYENNQYNNQPQAVINDLFRKILILIMQMLPMIIPILIPILMDIIIKYQM